MPRRTAHPCSSGAFLRIFTAEFQVFADIVCPGITFAPRNCDMNGGEADHDSGYDRLTVNRIVRLIRPPQLINRQDSFDHVLELFFVAGTLFQVAAGYVSAPRVHRRALTYEGRKPCSENTWISRGVKW
jgi:hypothetical protein